MRCFELARGFEKGPGREEFHWGHSLICVKQIARFDICRASGVFEQGRGKGRWKGGRGVRDVGRWGWSKGMTYEEGRGGRLIIIKIERKQE